MAIVKSNTFLDTLIQTGPDASLNLFSVSFKPIDDTLYNSQLSCRTTTFVTPKRNVVTTDILYQNIKIQKVASGSEIDKTVNFNIRLDDNYELLSYLRSKQCINGLGEFVEDVDKRFTITVDALKPYGSLLSNEQYTSIYRWKFYDCYITTVGDISFGYENSGAPNVVVSFVYSYFEESPYSNEEETIKTKNGLISSISKLLKKDN